MDRLTEAQKNIVEAPLTGRVFIEGIPGAGKTTVGCARVRRMLSAQRAGKRTLVFTPVASAGEAYRGIRTEDGRSAWVTTFNGFVQQNLNLFWPLIAAEAGYSAGGSAPLFLTIETAQVVLQSVAEPLWEGGAFNVLQWTLSRFLNQATMAMHKMAAAGFPFETYAERMKSSWSGDGTMRSVFDLIQRLGLSFKETCRADNMLDFALQLEIYQRCLAGNPLYRRWLQDHIQFFVHDNVEEDIPLAHAFGLSIRDIVDSSLAIYDELGGFRTFMGGDPDSARKLRDGADRTGVLSDSFVSSGSVRALAAVIENPNAPSASLPGNPVEAFRFHLTHYYPRMIKDAARDIAALVHGQGVDCRDIVIIAPLLSDVTYTMFERELRLKNLRAFAFRASRGLAVEIESRCLLTFLALLRPGWGYPIRNLDLVQTLRFFILGIDPLRLQLFVVKAFETAAEPDGTVRFTPKRLKEMAEKDTRECSPVFLSAFDRMSEWILARRDDETPPDQAVSDFFHNVLTQPGFAAHGSVAESFPLCFIKLIDSLKKYRKAMDALPEGRLTWRMYMRAVADGMVSATVRDNAAIFPENSILMTLAGGFIGLNRPFRYQVWLNAGSPRWWERIMGTLTNDAVLSTGWREGDVWDDYRKYERNQVEMQRLVQSLLARCGERIYVYASELNESGLDQKSNLLYLFADLSARLQPKLPIEYMPPIAGNDPAEAGLWDENWFETLAQDGSESEAEGE